MPFQRNRNAIDGPIAIAFDDDAIIVSELGAGAFVTQSCHGDAGDGNMAGGADHFAAMTGGIAETDDFLHALPF